MTSVDNERDNSAVQADVCARQAGQGGAGQARKQGGLRAQLYALPMLKKLYLIKAVLFLLFFWILYCKQTNS